MKTFTFLVATAAAVSALPTSIAPFFNATSTINAVRATTANSNNMTVSRIFPAYSCPAYNGVTDIDGLTNGNGGTASLPSTSLFFSPTNTPSQYTIECNHIIQGTTWNSVGYATNSDAVSTLDCLATCDYQAANGGCCGAIITPASECAIITGTCGGLLAEEEDYESFVWKGPA